MDRVRIRGAAQDALEDIFFGQIVIIWARWFVIVAIGLLALWGTDTTGELATRSLVVVGLMGVNFFLHGRALMERPANQLVVMAASLLDLAVVGGIVLAWDNAGLGSPYFVLYYPLLFAFSLVFPPRLTALYAALALGSYAVACLAADASFLDRAGDAKALVQRLITLGAMAGLGTYYWRIQRDRRRRLGSAPAAMPEL